MLSAHAVQGHLSKWLHCTVPLQVAEVAVEMRGMEANRFVIYRRGLEHWRQYALDSKRTRHLQVGSEPLS